LGVRGREADLEYTTSSLSQSARLPTLAVLLLWSGLMFDPSSPYLAMQWASTFSFSSFVVGVLLANAVLMVFSILSGYIASREGANICSCF